MNQPLAITQRARGRQAQLTGPNRWQVSYADFLTLLLGFFIVMYSVQSLESEQRQEIITALKASFGSQNQEIQPAKFSAPVAITANGLSYGEAIPFFSEDMQLVEEQGEWLALELASEAFFTSGSAVLTESSKRELKRLCDWLHGSAARIEIEGHTDDIPISTAEFPNNWALSSARAVAIVSFMQAQGLSGNRLRAIGFGEFSPVADNATVEGRQRNRRVVIKVERGQLPPLLPLPETGPATQGKTSDISAISALANPQDSGESDINSSDDDETTVLESLKSKGLSPERKASGGIKFSYDP